MSNFASKVAGGVFIFAGIASLAYFGWRTFNPTAADRARLDTIAEYGGTAAMAPADDRKIFLYGGGVAISAGSALFGRGMRR